ncbi:hypothetical protein DVH05_027702 [Phytophthora capsici]|nr:hypothetical protein DVH05_027702 [Phytophthora capsici]
MESGDEDDFVLKDGDYSEAEAARVIPRKQEEDAVDLSVGTTFDRMSKEDLSEHAKTGWITYFEDESKLKSCTVQAALLICLRQV